MKILAVVFSIAIIIFSIGCVTNGGKNSNISSIDNWSYCENSGDCVSVTCSCYCNGCGGFPYQDVVNERFVNDWYHQNNCTRPDICLDVCCSPNEIVCENNTCVVKSA